MLRLDLRPVNPECISAVTDLALALALLSLGQSPFSAYFSAKYSAMLRLSQILRSPSFKTGTFLEGEYLSIMAAYSGVNSFKEISSKGIPNWVSRIHGRKDQEEMFLFPITSFRSLITLRSLKAG